MQENFWCDKGLYVSEYDKAAAKKKNYIFHLCLQK